MLFVVDGEKEFDAEADICIPEADDAECPDAVGELLDVDVEVLL